MRRWPARLAACVVFVLSMVVLWSTLLSVNLPQICGIGPSRWWSVVERLAFLPTYWVTAPLDRALALHGLGGFVFVVSCVETLGLSLLYAATAFHLTRSSLGSAAARTWRSRRRLLVASAIGVAAVSVWARVETSRLDYRKELEKQAAEPPVVEPPATAETLLTLVQTARPRLPSGFAVGGMVQGAGGAWLLAVRERAPQDFDHSVLGILSIQTDALVIVREFEIDGSAIMPRFSPRYPLSPQDPEAVAMDGSYGGRQRLLIDIGWRASLKDIAVGQSAVPIASAGRFLVPSLGYWSGEPSPGVPFMPTYERPMHSTFSAEVWHIDSEVQRVVGTTGPLGDHGSSNLDAVLNPSNLLHLLVAEVVVGAENASRIHHFAWDTRTSTWSDHSVLMSRQHFTSDANPRLARIGRDTLAAWSYDGGAENYADDGLYVHLLGSGTTSRLTRKGGAFALLPADGRSENLVAVVEGGSQVLSWFGSLDGATWRRLATTPLPEGTYVSPLDGTQSFALWRTAAGVHAVFNTEAGISVQVFSTKTN